MITRYKLFTTPTCPGCPAIKEHMKSMTLEGEIFDASTPEGSEEAAKHEIRSVPTVLFFDESNNVVETAQSVKQVQRVLE